MKRCCDDFSRSKLLHRAAAEAGRGLPAIEPGMPLPAGTGLSRRGLLLRSAGLALSIYGLDRIRPGLIEAGVARAASGPADAILVSIFLEGGADGLSVLYPADDAVYKSLRPKLALSAGAGTVFAEDPRFHWHPSLGPLAALHAQGKVAVLPAVGYTNADQSHFTSRHYWEVGNTDPYLQTGWLGRYLDVTGTPDNPLQGLSLDGQLSPTLATASVPVAAIDAPASYDLDVNHVWGSVHDHMLEAMEALGVRLAGDDPGRAGAARVALQAHRLHEQLAPFADDGSTPVPYPQGTFAEQLSSLAKLIAAGLPLRCVALSAPGSYDTHAGQPDALTEGLSATAAALAAFQSDLESRGLADRVLVHVWSEFGRRVEENGSLGTDHGAAGVGFVIGSRVNGQLIGEPPDLATGLDDDGNLKATADFRQLYCALLEQWLGVDADAVIPGASAFTRPQVVA
jgi:uncharacterized protein (DUF1501 family)